MTSRPLRSLALASCLAACTAGSPPPGPVVAEPPPADPSAPVGSPPVEPADPPAASEPGFPGSSWQVTDLGVSVPDAWRSCNASTDCALVVTTCCDQCNGGKAVAVNSAHAKDVAAKHPKSCQDVACTERGCMTRASCQESRCVMEWQSASP